MSQKKNRDIEVWSDQGCISDDLQSVRKGKKLMRKAKEKGETKVRMTVRNVNSPGGRYYHFNGEDIIHEKDADV